MYKKKAIRTSPIALTTFDIFVINQNFFLVITNIISYMINSTYLLNIILPVLTFFAMIYIF